MKKMSAVGGHNKASSSIHGAAFALSLLLAVLACTPPSPASSEDGDVADDSAPQCEATSGEATVVADVAIVRAEPDTDAPQVDALVRGDIVTLRCVTPDGDWYLVALSGTAGGADEGWVAAAFLSSDTNVDTASGLTPTDGRPLDNPTPGLTVTVEDFRPTSVVPTNTVIPPPTVTPTTTAQAIELTPVAQPAGDIVFRSERSGNFDVYAMGINGSNPVRMTDSGGPDDCPDWSPDGRRIAYVSNNQINVMNADGTGVTQLTSGAYVFGCPDWSPDGSQIAFHSNMVGNFDIYVMDDDGGNVTRKTFDSETDADPSWSPDGRSIAFRSHRSGGPHIYVMDASNGSIQAQLTTSGENYRPAWSPDGSRIVFESRRSNNWDLYAVRTDGTNEERLTSDPATEANPSWSPDSNRILFDSDRDGDFDIYIKNAVPGGSGVSQLTNAPGDDRNGDWIPDF